MTSRAPYRGMASVLTDPVITWRYALFIAGLFLFITAMVWTACEPNDPQIDPFTQTVAPPVSTDVTDG